MILTRVAEAAGGVPLGVGLSLADAKQHLSVYHDTDDALISGLCAVARSHIEGPDGLGGPLGCAVTQHVLDGTLAAFPAGSIYLPQPPLSAVAWVRYVDHANALQTLPPDVYHVLADPMRPQIIRAAGAPWPATAVRPDAVTVRFTAGPAEVPPSLLHALKLHVGHLYLNREIALEKSLISMPMGYDALVSPYRRHGWV